MASIRSRDPSLSSATVYFLPLSTESARVLLIRAFGLRQTKRVILEKLRESFTGRERREGESYSTSRWKSINIIIAWKSVR